jgi:hypothetical protein
MTMFIPPQQLRNMIQNQALQTLSNSTDPTARIVALNALAQTIPGQPADLMKPIPVNNDCGGWGWVDDLF